MKIFIAALKNLNIFSLFLHGCVLDLVFYIPNPLSLPNNWSSNKIRARKTVRLEKAKSQGTAAFHGPPVFITLPTNTREESPSENTQIQSITRNIVFCIPLNFILSSASRSWKGSLSSRCYNHNRNQFSPIPGHLSLVHWNALMICEQTYEIMMLLCM